ncbi:hypothetical protein [Jiangella mangrovi]|uniref:Uncharacterized protein n=1 Tax=Jiangella mangrovi TaxID=1524084 RepID=A0A7W9LJP5_9ACTN|nr:hypothetical protein [Jiangella mangrovi]MBB5786296.1 hypothetical protein [Jiangella mangrovi]
MCVYMSVVDSPGSGSSRVSYGAANIVYPPVIDTGWVTDEARLLTGSVVRLR